MESVDWSQVAAMVAVIGLYTHMVVEWIKTKGKLNQVCHYLGLDENGNPVRDAAGKVKRQIDSDVVREIFRDEIRKDSPPTIKLPRTEEAS